MNDEGTHSASWVIETDRLGRKFGVRHVLADVTLRVRRGEIFGLLGPDGSGKTTLMQLLAAILDPSEGKCRVLGFDTVTDASSIHSQIGFMSQGFTLYERLTVEENLAFAARIRGVERHAMTERQHQLLAMTGLSDFMDRRAEHLSGGMRKKLSLCANLIHEPPLLILDELSLGVDPASRRELWSILRAFQKEGTTTVLTTPYMDEAEHCDRLGFLSEGRLLATGTSNELQVRGEGTVYEIPTVRAGPVMAALGSSPDVVASQVLPDRVRFQVTAPDQLPESLRGRPELGGPIRVAPASLEDVFIRLTTDRSSSAVTPNPPALDFKTYEGAPEKEVVRLNNLVCRFGSFTAVDRVTLKVDRGVVYGFLGPNGAGKTTLIRAMCGLLRPAEGDVYVAGTDVVRSPRRVSQRIGYMSQRFSLYTDLTADENLAFFSGVYGLRSHAKREAVDWAKEMTALKDIPDHRVSDLSGAVRQRLALACSVLHRPPVLFLDEPTSGIDPVSRQRFWRLIGSLAEAAMTVFVTTHYLEEATYCHRLGLMFQGRLVADGTAAELRKALGAEEALSIEDVFMAYIERERARFASGNRREGL